MRRRTIIVAASTASLLPLLLLWQHFQFLFLFHDDWLMLDSLDRLGFGRWLVDSFAAEGFFPLFKILWWGALHAAGGSYFAMIGILWVTHAGVCLLLGWLLARFGMAPAAIAFAVLMFGLAWSNMETLGWLMQWNAVLSLLFFLAAWHLLIDGRNVGAAVLLLAAALCSSRGITLGMVLAVFVAVDEKARIRRCLFCVGPVVLIVAVSWSFTPRHSFVGGATLHYAIEYLLLNPLFLLLPFLHVKFEAGDLLIFGLLKIAVVVWAFRKAAPAGRKLLWTLVALDLVFAISLGYARWQTGLATATSSRYQYVPLLCFGTFAGIVLARLRPRSHMAIALLSIVGVTVPWKRHIEQWSTARGKMIRSAIVRNDAGQTFDPSLITAGRARDLSRSYGLH